MSGTRDIFTAQEVEFARLQNEAALARERMELDHHAAVMKKQVEMAKIMAPVPLTGLQAALSGQLGQLGNQQSFVNQQYNQQVAQAAQGYQNYTGAPPVYTTAQTAAFPQTPYPPTPTPSPALTRLNEVAALLAIPGAERMEDGWMVLADALHEIVRRTGVQTPIAKEVDLIDALTEVKDRQWLQQKTL